MNAKLKLDQKGIFQWTDNYPTKAIVTNDINNGDLHTLIIDKKIIGVVVINEDQDLEYQTIKWHFNASKILVIHRLVVHPNFQKQGNAQHLIEFAECYAKTHNYSSIRLDAYSQNKRVIEFYKKRNFLIRGNVNFPERQFPFHCMEKELKSIKL